MPEDNAGIGGIVFDRERERERERESKSLQRGKMKRRCTCIRFGWIIVGPRRTIIVVDEMATSPDIELPLSKLARQSR